MQWREGSRPGSRRSGFRRMCSRFVALRIRPAGREIRKAAGGPDLPVRRLLAEWPANQPEPVQFWLSNLPADTPPATLVRTVKLRRRIEHDYRERKQALGLVLAGRHDSPNGRQGTTSPVRVSRPPRRGYRRDGGAWLRAGAARDVVIGRRASAGVSLNCE